MHLDGADTIVGTVTDSWNAVRGAVGEAVEQAESAVLTTIGTAEALAIASVKGSWNVVWGLMESTADAVKAAAGSQAQQSAARVQRFVTTGIEHARVSPWMVRMSH